MSAQRNNDDAEALFSLELLVEWVRLERESRASDELALGVRLLDFPTLLVYGSRRSGRRGGERVFNRGKACFFRMNADSLRARLLGVPLHAMVLDVREETPRLVGTSLISLANVMDGIGRDAPSSHGERGVVRVCNLLGENVGSISLSYKLLRLGADALPLHADGRSTGGHGEQHVQAQERVEEKRVSTELRPPECGNVSSPALDEIDVGRNDANEPSNEENLMHEDKRDGEVCIATPTDLKPRAQIRRAAEERESGLEDLTTLCPPHLFYTNSAKEQSQTEGRDCKLANPDCESFVFEDTCSEEETPDIKIECIDAPLMDQTARPGVKRNQQRNGVTPGAFGEALQRLPLLNALLVELSQISGQNSDRPLSVHPNLSWIYGPAAPAPSVGRGNPTGEAPTDAAQKARRVASPQHPKRNCSTPVVRSSSGRVNDGPDLIKGTSPRKRLTYGTTKTYNLRLKQLSSRGVKRHGRAELIPNETQTRAIKGKTKESNGIPRSSEKRRSALSQSASLDGNVETMIQSITEESALQKTITLKQKNPKEKSSSKKHRSPLRVSDKSSLSERDLSVIHVPGVDGEVVAKDKEESESHVESNRSESDSDGHGDKSESSGSSGHSSRKSSVSDSGGEGGENADYTDDFNSLGPSDADSPDSAKSPEPSRARAPESPEPSRARAPESPARPDVRDSDCGSEVSRRRAVLPRPIKASGSPRRSLRGAYVVRPRTHASALSFSSSDGDGDGDGWASSQTAGSRKRTEGGGRVERVSGADTLVSSRGQRSESRRNSRPGHGSSEESVSSFEPQEMEELEEGLGSLDFRNQYRHISKLVASKLPGYTM